MLFETKAVTKYNTSKHGKLLDIGSGTGHFINLLKKNINCIGVDNYYFMVKRAKYNYPENVYIQQNILDSMGGFVGIITLILIVTVFHKFYKNN